MSGVSAQSQSPWRSGTVRIRRALLVTALALASPAALAGGDHAHDKGPHGGEVKSFGAYHLEAHRSGDTVTVYLLGDDGKTAATMTDHSGGLATVVCGKEKRKEDIEAGKAFSKQTLIASPAGVCKVTVSIKEQGKTVAAKFSLAE